MGSRRKPRIFNIDLGIVGIYAVFVVAIFLTLISLNYRILGDSNELQHVNSNSYMKNGYCWGSEEEINKGTTNLLPLLNRITAKPYFRFFKVNTQKPCPFWVVNLLCMDRENPCRVCRCDENNIPKELREEVDMSEYAIPGAHISQIIPNPRNVDSWGTWATKDKEAEYVDLLQNPEANTGFVGPMAAKVWRAIHDENCFISDESNCTESRVLQSLLAGLRTSIGIHVCTNFYKDPKFESTLYSSGLYNNPNISFFPNCKMFREKVYPMKEFIQNLYTLFQFTLRALTKAKYAFIEDMQRFNYSENSALSLGHEELHSDLLELFNSNLLCTKTFDEVSFLNSPKGRELVPQMKHILANISAIMDCVPCEKCRVWGKLSIKGLATATEINMNLRSSNIRLNRAEKFALLNLARQLSFSVKSLHVLNEICAG